MRPGQTSTLALTRAAPDAVIDVFDEGVFQALLTNGAVSANLLRFNNAESIARKEHSRRIRAATSIGHPLCAHTAPLRGFYFHSSQYFVWKALRLGYILQRVTSEDYLAIQSVEWTSCKNATQRSIVSQIPTAEAVEVTDPVGHVQVIYLGPVAPHWECRMVFGDEEQIQAFVDRIDARLRLLPPHDPQFRRNRERVNRDAERENLLVEWNLGYDEEA